MVFMGLPITGYFDGIKRVRMRWQYQCIQLTLLSVSLFITSSTDNPS